MKLPYFLHLSTLVRIYVCVYKYHALAYLLQPNQAETFQEKGKREKKVTSYSLSDEMTSQASFPLADSTLAGRNSRMDAAPTSDVLKRKRSRLYRSGALMSSRSAVSRLDAVEDLEVVDVGEGKVANQVEELLARMEQHGLRRCFAAEDNPSTYTVDEVLRNSEAEISATAACFGGDDGDANKRETYFYLCVPCEQRLTMVSQRAADMRMLEDIHYHFSAAAHRSAASWMADPDIDETLKVSPLVYPSTCYSRIFVNGVPMLLSRNPGGGGMFYPLPHEADSIRPTHRHRDGFAGKVSEGNETSIGLVSEFNGADYPLFPPQKLRSHEGRDSVYWYHPIQSLYTGSIQVLRRSGIEREPVQERKTRFRVRRAAARRMVKVDHVPLDVYRENSFMKFSSVPTQPTLFEVRKERVPKWVLASGLGEQEPLSRNGEDTEDVPHRSIYTQPFEPLCSCNAEVSPSWPSHAAPLVVFEEDSYRLALRSEEDQKTTGSIVAPGPRAAELPQGQGTQEHFKLTREALSQLTESRGLNGPFASPAEGDSYTLSGTPPFSHLNSNFSNSNFTPSRASSVSQ